MERSDEARSAGTSRRKCILLIVALVFAAVAALVLAFSGARRVVKAYTIVGSSMEPTLYPRDTIMVNCFAYAFDDPMRGDVITYRVPPNAFPDGSGADHIFAGRVVAVPGDTVRMTGGYVSAGEDRYRHYELASVLFPKNAGEVSVKLGDDRVSLNGKLVSEARLAAALGVRDKSVQVVPGRLFINAKLKDEPYTAEDADIDYPGDPRCRVETAWIERDRQGHKVVRIPKNRLLVMGDNRNNANDSRYWGLLDVKRVIGKVEQVVLPQERAGQVK